MLLTDNMLESEFLSESWSVEVSRSQRPVEIPGGQKLLVKPCFCGDRCECSTWCRPPGVHQTNLNLSKPEHHRVYFCMFLMTASFQLDLSSCMINHSCGHSVSWRSQSWDDWIGGGGGAPSGWWHDCGSHTAHGPV